MPFGGPGSRRARAERLVPLLDVQLRFAAALAGRRGESMVHGVTHYTNFHRRFGYGRLHDGVPAAGWATFLEAIRAAPDHAARLDAAQRAFVAGGEEVPLGGQAVFGCFGYAPPDADGVVRIHFLDRDPPGGPGPLSRARLDRRRGDLTRMTRDLVGVHPGARVIRGRSWLYNLEAYRRLFPPAYVARPRNARSGTHFTGSGCWGQFQRSWGVDAVACAVLAGRLDDLDAERPWTILPLQPLEVEAPVARFAEQFGAHPGE